MKPCGFAACEGLATARIFWPGRPPLAVCALCLMRALNVASALGLHLHHEPIEPREVAPE